MLASLARCQEHFLRDIFVRPRNNEAGAAMARLGNGLPSWFAVNGMYVNDCVRDASLYLFNDFANTCISEN